MRNLLQRGYLQVNAYPLDHPSRHQHVLIIWAIMLPRKTDCNQKDDENLLEYTLNNYLWKVSSGMNQDKQSNQMGIFCLHIYVLKSSNHLLLTFFFLQRKDNLYNNFHNRIICTHIWQIRQCIKKCINTSRISKRNHRVTIVRFTIVPGLLNRGGYSSLVFWL